MLAPTGVREVDLEDQARSFEVMFQVLAGRSWYRGMYWWKWSSRPSKRPDTSYVINSKPAEAVISKWFEVLGADQPPMP